jgi:hypothetical protein
MQVEPNGGPALLVRAPMSWLAHTRVDVEKGCPNLSGPTDAGPQPAETEPNPAALALVAPGALVPGSRLQTIEISRQAISARGGMGSGCRALLEEHRSSLTAARTCATDADCRLTRPLPAPGSGNRCGIATSGATTFAAFEDLRKRFEASCRPLTLGRGCEPALVDALAHGLLAGSCSEGRCQSLCPRSAPTSFCRPCSAIEDHVADGARCSYAVAT